MNFTDLRSSNTFADLKVNTKLDHLFQKRDYNLSNKKFLEKLKFFGYAIDSVSKFSYKGLYYQNPLIFAISSKNIELVEILLQNGSASRGYYQYPGYPLYFTINKINEYLEIKNLDFIDDFISIIKLLTSYGARFDDYIIHIFWFKFDNMCKSLSHGQRQTVMKLYSKSPFEYSKYKKYLDIYCSSFIGNQKESMLNLFLEKHPIKRSSSFRSLNFFSFN